MVVIQYFSVVIKTPDLPFLFCLFVMENIFIILWDDTVVSMLCYPLPPLKIQDK